jgi:hypothetical protein
MQNTPISKHDATNRLSTEVEDTVNVIVGLINDKLVNYSVGIHISVDMSRFESDLTNEVWQKVKQRVIDLFSAKGWRIVFNDGSQQESLSQFDLS